VKTIYDVKKVLVDNCNIFTQPWDPDTPAVPPEDTAALGEAWTDPWASAGATDSGLTYAVSRSITDVTIDNQMTPASQYTESMDIHAEFNLAEDTMESMALAYGATLAKVAASSGTPGTTTLTISEDLPYLALGFEGKTPAGFWRRVVLPRVANTAEVSTAYNRSGDKRMYQCSFKLYQAPSTASIREMTAKATSA
jgi:hypothetical protein